MTQTMKDPTDEISCWDGKRLRFIVVWEPETNMLNVRMSPQQLIPTLGIIERAKMVMIEEHVMARVKQETQAVQPNEPPAEGDMKIILFPGGPQGQM